MTRDEMAALIREVTTDILRDQREAGPTPHETLQAMLARMPATPRDPAALGLRAAQLFRAVAGATFNKTSPTAFAAKVYGKEHPVTKALEASDFAAGGALVPTEFSSEIIELLRERSVFRAAGPVIMPMASGSMEVPKLTGGATASYLGESENVTASAQTFGNIKLSWKKLGVIIPISNDLLRFGAVNADTVVRDDTIAAMGDAEDANFLRSPGTEHSPKGLRYWAPAANVADVTSSYDLAKVTKDLAGMILKLRNGLSRMIRPVWFMAPRTELYLASVRDSNGNFAFREEMNTGRLWRFPYFSTTRVPITLGTGAQSEIILADMADVVIGEAQTLEVTASDTAAYYDGSAVQAAFSRDQTVLRVLAHHDLGVRHPESIAVLTAVDWSPTA